MDVVGGKIVAAQNKGSEPRFGVKRPSPDCVLEGPNASFKTNQLSWRVKAEGGRDWGGGKGVGGNHHQSPSENCNDGLGSEFRGMFSCGSQSSAKGMGSSSALGLRLPTSSNSNNNNMGVGGKDGGGSLGGMSLEGGRPLGGFNFGGNSCDCSFRTSTGSSSLASCMVQAQQEASMGASSCGALKPWTPPPSTFSDTHHNPTDNPRILLPPLYTQSHPAFTQQGRSWVDPLRFLLKKELTVTDVGELGRIVLPKRDAEGQLPHLDSKEGKLLTLEDYNSNKNWSLRYKWWPNNKSRMYVLESTGEFVKYHDLKDKDELIVYRDGVGKLVIRAQKWSSSASRTGSGCGPYGYKGKSTGKRSPKGLTRSNSAAARTDVSSSSAQTTSKRMAPPPTCLGLKSARANELDDGLDCKLGLTHSPPPNTLVHTLSDPGVLHRTSGDPLDSPLDTSAQSTLSKLTVNSLDAGLLCPASSNSISYVEPVEMISYNQMAMQSDAGLDWEKLPDPPAIEFAASFDLEGDWGNCIL